MTDQSTRGSSDVRSSSLTPRRIVALVLATLSAAFVLQNRGDATLSVFGISFTAPLWLFTLALLGIGIVIGVLLARRSST